MKRLMRIRFAKIKFLVTHCWTHNAGYSAVEGTTSDLPVALIDINDPSHDFTIRPLIGRFFGLCEYLTLSTIGNTDVCSEDNLKLLIGSINIALQNTQCQLPVFVQLHNKKLSIYQGTMVSKDIRSNF